MSVESVQDFVQHVAAVEERPGYRRAVAFGVGLATFSITDLGAPATLGEDAAVLDTWFPAPNCHENHGAAAVLAGVVGHVSGSASYVLDIEQLRAALGFFAPFEGDGQVHPNVDAMKQLLACLMRGEQAAVRYARGEASLCEALPQRVVVTFIGDLDAKPTDPHDAYLRLHLLSSRRVAPQGLNLEGLFGLLSNVVWTDVGPFAVDGFEQVRGLLRSQGVRVHVQSVDKFPRMSDYVVPAGVRVADTDRVRLGAHLASGTTVMHEGFVNFNAGTLGSSMVEGRISAGVVVDDGSDVGGGASIMGTLSGGGQAVIRLGKRCLLGANAGCGIPLGDRCTIEAGLYVTAGTKVTLPDGEVVKASSLAGRDELLFRRNSQNGAVEVLYQRNEVALNEALHKN